MTGEMKSTLPLIFLVIYFEEFVGCNGGECSGGDYALCQSPHCDEGCTRFNPSDTCRNACNFTWSHLGVGVKSEAENTLSCLNGCKMAASRFAQRVTEEAILQSPRIIPESITDTAMSLLWRHKEESIRGGTFYLQSSKRKRQHWTNVQQINVDFGAAHEQVFRVDSLVPYEKYRFRVSWRLPEAELHSPPSKAARTKADDFGRPSRPILESVRQERGLRVSIAWRPPMEPRGPLAFYRLSIRGVSPDLKDRAEVMIECNNCLTLPN